MQSICHVDVTRSLVLYFGLTTTLNDVANPGFLPSLYFGLTTTLNDVANPGLAKGGEGYRLGG